MAFGTITASVGSSQNSASAVTITNVVSSAGDLIVVLVAQVLGASVTVSGSTDGSFTKDAGYASNNNRLSSVWSFTNSAGATQTITITPNTTEYLNIVVLVCPGGATSSALNTPVTNTGTSVTPSTGSITATSGDLVVGVLSPSSVFQTQLSSVSAGIIYSDGGGGTQPALFYAVIASGATTCASTLGSSSAWSAAGASYKPASYPSGGGGPLPSGTFVRSIGTY